MKASILYGWIHPTLKFPLCCKILKDLKRVCRAGGKIVLESDKKIASQLENLFPDFLPYKQASYGHTVISYYEAKAQGGPE